MGGPSARGIMKPSTYKQDVSLYKDAPERDMRFSQHLVPIGVW